MEIAVVGCGYVGLVTAACFADLGNRVVGVDVDARRVAALRRGRIPIYEPGLEEIVRRTQRDGRLSFTTSLSDAIRRARIVFIAVGTPPTASGDVDLSAVEAVAAGIGRELDGPKIVVNKSTVPVGMADAVGDAIQRHARRGKHRVDVVSNPEFLREGSAVADFMNPDRVVVGSRNRKAAEEVAALYKPLRARTVVTDVRSAEMIKYASNAFLATKISFINEIARICEALGADVNQVAAGMGMDRRIGKEFLSAGAGFGGSCLPKDVSALLRAAERAHVEPRILRAALEVNEAQRRSVVEKLESALGSVAGKTVAVLGLAFKPNTDDLREAVSMTVLPALLSRGVRVRAYDPAANARAKVLVPGPLYARSVREAVRGAHGIIVLTEWNEFVEMDLAKLRRLSGARRPALIDARNVYDPAAARAAGFEYRGVGRT